MLSIHPPSTATVAVGVLGFVGLSDPAVVGGLHIVLWVLIAVAFARSGSKTTSSETHPDPTSTSAPTTDAEALSGQDVVPEAGPPARPSDAEPSTPEVTGSHDVTRVDSTPTGASSKRAAMAAALLLLLGLVALSGFLGARYAVDRAATTTTIPAIVTPADVDPNERDDLTNAEKVWCWRDAETLIAVISAANILGFYDFSANLQDARDGDADAVADLLNDVGRWADEEGEDEQDREMAIACRAAFSGR